MSILHKNLWALLLICLGIFASCEREKIFPINRFRASEEEILKQYVPDKRLGIFEAQMKYQGDTLVIEGKTDNAEAKKAFIASLNSKGIRSFVDSIAILPEEGLGRKAFGIVNISVANIRTDGKHWAGMAKQGSLGQVVKLLEQKGTWFHAQTPDKYLGWISDGSIVFKTEEEAQQWIDMPKIIYTKNVGWAYQNNFTREAIVSDLVYGNTLGLIQELDNRFKVQYPDGREAYILKNEAMKLNEWQKSRKLDKEGLLKTANTYLGIPYYWGGNSYKGVDCSGFTKGIFFANGLRLPRDASQQALIGDDVDTTDYFNLLEEGDLLYFGKFATDSTKEKVTHVGLWIGDMQFIHASGRVHISSFDSTAQNFDAYNLNRLLNVKRILGSENLEGTTDLTTATTF